MKTLNTPDTKMKEMAMPSAQMKIAQMPDPEQKKVQNPTPGDEKNIIVVGGEPLEIKATRLLYQRNQTAAFYKILQKVPLVDILRFEDGIVDPERSSDKAVFDWLVAVTDNVDYVTRHYDEFDTETVQKMLEIFLRLNHIDEKEERKKAKAQMKP